MSIMESVSIDTDEERLIDNNIYKFIYISQIYDEK